MNIESFRDFCMSLPNVTEDFPFDDTTLVFRVGGKIFAIVGLLGSIAIDKGLDAKTRRQMLKEFDTEIQVIDEKISDARSAGKRREKYHLMRLKNKLESERTRVRYGLRE